MPVSCPGTRGTFYLPRFRDAGETLCHVSAGYPYASWSQEELHWADSQPELQPVWKWLQVAGQKPAAPSGSASAPATKNALRSVAPGPPTAAQAPTPPTTAQAPAAAAPAPPPQPAAAPPPAAAAAAPPPNFAAAAGSAGMVTLELQPGSQVRLQVEAGGSITLRLAAPPGAPLSLNLTAGSLGGGAAEAAVPANSPDIAPQEEQHPQEQHRQHHHQQQQQREKSEQQGQWRFQATPQTEPARQVPNATPAPAAPGSAATAPPRFGFAGTCARTPGSSSSTRSGKLVWAEGSSSSASSSWASVQEDEAGSDSGDANQPGGGGESGSEEAGNGSHSPSGGAVAAGAAVAGQGPAGLDGSCSLHVRDANWDKPDLPPDWHLTVRQGDRTLRRIRLGSSAEAPCRVCRADRSLVLLPIHASKAGGREDAYQTSSSSSTATTTPTVSGSGSTVWRLGQRQLHRLERLLTRATTENVCGCRLWSRRGQGLLRPQLLPGVAAALLAMPAKAAEEAEAPEADGTAEAAEAGETAAPRATSAGSSAGAAGAAPGKVASEGAAPSSAGFAAAPEGVEGEQESEWEKVPVGGGEAGKAGDGSGGSPGAAAADDDGDGDGSFQAAGASSSIPGSSGSPRAASRTSSGSGVLVAPVGAEVRPGEQCGQQQAPAIAIDSTFSIYNAWPVDDGQ